MCPSPASFVQHLTVLGGHVSPSRQDVHAECVVLSRITWLTAIFHSWVHGTALAPVGSEDSVNEQREEAGSWYLRISGCCPSHRLPRPEEGAVYSVSTGISVSQIAIWEPSFCRSCWSVGCVWAITWWQTCPRGQMAALPAGQLIWPTHCSLGLGKRAKGHHAYPNRQSVAVAFTRDQLIPFTEHQKYFISYLWISFLSQIVPDRMLFHLLKIWGSCPPLLETVLLPLIPEEL